MHRTLSVLIMGKDRIFTEALEMVLATAEDLRIVGSAAGHGKDDNGGDIDIVLIDASFNPTAALYDVWAAQEQFPGAELVVIGLESEGAEVLDFIEAGAATYVLQSATPARLMDVLRFLRDGRVEAPPEIAAAVLARIAALEREGVAPPPPPGEPLTVRELETLSCLARGLRNKEIAQALHITVQTVKNHVHSILEKLQVHRRREAVRLAYDLGLLSEPRGPQDLY